MNEIGGYFEIEFSNINLKGIHRNAIKLNTARNCLEYILLSNSYKKIFVPYYTCDVVLEPIIKHDIEFEFYHIDKNFEPVNSPIIKQNEAFLYTNYFGTKEQFVTKIAERTENLIVDNSQALFSAPVQGVDTFYSLRKFVGVPDGAFLYSSKNVDFEIVRATSANRVSHLYQRKDVSAPFGYKSFKENDESFIGLPIMKMSASTEAFLNTYDFEKNKITRERNFLYLHYKLHQFNEIEIDISKISAPLGYPFLSANVNTKQFLTEKGVYIPTYWANVLDWIKNDDVFEKTLVNNLLVLPLDHRYEIEDLNFLIENLLK